MAILFCPFALLVWLGFSQPDSLANFIAMPPSLRVLCVGLLLLAIGGGFVLVRDCVAALRPGKAGIHRDVVVSHVRPFFRALCGVIGVLGLFAGGVGSFVLTEELIKAPGTAVSEPLWLWGLLLAGLTSSFVLGAAFLYSAVSGREPWLLRGKRKRSEP
jgi:molybdopterin/thiamine biosynthesis adenylyltransferase